VPGLLMSCESFYIIVNIRKTLSQNRFNDKNQNILI